VVCCSYQGVVLCYVGHPRLSCTFERANMQLMFEEAQEVAVLRCLALRGGSSITKGELCLPNKRAKPCLPLLPFEALRLLGLNS
jgi:hypothetical protein